MAGGAPRDARGEPRAEARGESLSGPLSSRVALITGASRGLGAAVAVELARLGAHVVITARTPGGLEDTDDAVRQVGGGATLLPLDLREPDQLEAIAPRVFARLGRVAAP